MRPLLAIALLATALAGCVSPGPAPGPGGEALPPGGTWRLDCGISNWAERCNARASPNESPSKTEIDIAVNPTDLRNVFVASKDLDPVASDCVWSVGQATKDGGRTWSTVYVGGTAQDRMLPDHPMFGWTCVTDPILAFDSGGTLYYPLQAYSLAPSTAPDAPLPFGGGSSFWLGVSRDGGLTFPTEDILLMAIADGGLVFHDYPRMAVSPATDSVSTVWNAVGVAGVNPYVVTTRDGGESVDPPTVVAFPDAPRTTQFASGFAADPDGSFYMTVLKATPQIGRAHV